MNQYKKLGKNIFLLTLGNFSSKILSFFLIPVYTSVLTTKEYGIADLMTATINLIIPFFTLLMGEAVMRFALDDKYDKKQVFSVSLYIGLAGTALVCLFSPLVTFIDGLSAYCLEFVIFYFITMMYTVISQFVKGIERVKEYTANGVISTVVFISLNILFLLVLKLGIRGYIWSLILANAIASLYLMLSTRGWRYVVYPWKLDMNVMRRMLRYSVPMIPNSMSWWISNSSDKYIVSAVCGLAVTGVYSIAYRIPSIFSIISSIFIGAWQISAVEDFGSEKSVEFYSKIYKFYTAANMFIISAMICATKLLAGFLFSNDFFEAWIFVPILLISYMFNATSAFLGTVYTSAKRTTMIFVSTVIGAVLNIVFNFILVRYIGAMGAAIATFISYFVIWTIRIIDTRRIIKIKIDWNIDILSYLLIFCQCIIMCMDIKYSIVICAILFIILAVCRYKDIYLIVNLLKERLKRKLC